MKESNEVLTQEVDQEQIDTLTKSAQEHHQSAKVFNHNVAEGKQVTTAWAAVSFAFSFGPDGGSCSGWITYHDGRILKYYGEFTRRHGLPVTMRTDLPAVLVLPYETLCDARSEYYATGYGTTGGMSMTCNGDQVSPLPWPVNGLGAFQWSTEGVGKFTPA